MLIEETRTEVAIGGMRNNDCRERVSQCLTRVKGVKCVDVSLLRAVAVVVHSPPCQSAQLLSAVRGLGYASELGQSHGRDAGV